MYTSNIKNIVLDMHGIVYCHSNDYNLETSALNFEKEIQKYENTIEIQKLTDPQQIEYDSILKGLNNSSCLQLFYLPKFSSNYKTIFSSENHVIIISNSLIKTSTLILKQFFQSNHFNYKLENIDFFNTNDFGSKKESKTWEIILSKYTHIEEIFEDKYLEPALISCTLLGFKTQGHLSI